MIEEDVFFFEYISLPAFSIRETVYFKPASSFAYTVRGYEMIKRVISTFPIFIKKFCNRNMKVVEFVIILSYEAISTTKSLARMQVYEMKDLC